MVANETLKDLEVAVEVDCRGDLCPLPVYKTSLAMRRINDGEVLRLLCTDPGALADIPALARQTGHKLLGQAEGDDAQIFWLRKAGGV